MAMTLDPLIANYNIEDLSVEDSTDKEHPKKVQ